MRVLFQLRINLRFLAVKKSVCCDICVQGTKMSQQKDVRFIYALPISVYFLYKRIELKKYADGIHVAKLSIRIEFVKDVKIITQTFLKPVFSWHQKA